jgi:SAM-dependent methyltransferase
LTPVIERKPISASLRDPAGRLFRYQGRILRLVNTAAAESLKEALDIPAARQWLEEGHLAATRFLDEQECRTLLSDPEIAALAASVPDPVLLEHGAIEFPTFPYEWIPEMLLDAASLTLRIAGGLLPHNVTLKDATPYNILFEGTRPVFVDVPSLEPRDPRDPTWLAYAQFVRTFLLPLFVQHRFGLNPAQIFLGRWDGWDPEEVYRMAGWGTRLSRPCLSLATIPHWLARGHDPGETTVYAGRRTGNPEKAAYIMESLLSGLGGQLAQCWPDVPRKSDWSTYTETTHDAGYYELRGRLIKEAFDRYPASRVLDIGCNTGRYSLQAARRGARVVALDLDLAALGHLWTQARSQSLPVAVCYANIARPSPATGWRNGECPSLLERLSGRFDAVFMLAVLHHLLVTERIPLPEVASLAAELTRDLLIIEFVAPHDDLFRTLTRGRGPLHEQLTRESFELAFGRYFESVQCDEVMPGRRWLYTLRKRSGGQW